MDLVSTTSILYKRRDSYFLSINKLETLRMTVVLLFFLELLLDMHSKQDDRLHVSLHRTACVVKSAFFEELSIQFF